MKKQSKTLFWVSEINLCLWLASLGMILFGDWSDPDILRTAKVIIIAGCVLAALLQHWAYHKIYKPIRQQEKEK